MTGKIMACMDSSIRDMAAKIREHRQKAESQGKDINLDVALKLKVLLKGTGFAGAHDEE